MKIESNVFISNQCIVFKRISHNSQLRIVRNDSIWLFNNPFTSKMFSLLCLFLLLIAWIGCFWRAKFFNKSHSIHECDVFLILVMLLIRFGCCCFWLEAFFSYHEMVLSDDTTRYKQLCCFYLNSMEKDLIKSNSKRANEQSSFFQLDKWIRSILDPKQIESKTLLFHSVSMVVHLGGWTLPAPDKTLNQICFCRSIERDLSPSCCYWYVFITIQKTNRTHT